MSNNLFPEIDTKYPEFYQIFGAYFHQNVSSLDAGIEDFLDNPLKALITSMIEIDRFISDDNFSDDEKKEYIQKVTSYSFDAVGLDSLEWVKSFREKINERIKKLESK